MKNRTDEVWAALATFIEERGLRDISQIVPAFETHAKTLVQNMRAALLSCNEQALELQRKAEKCETAFVTLSFLDSSILSGAYDLRIDFYDGGFLGDIAEACVYFAYSPLIPIYQESVSVICREATKHFTRFMDYEKNALAWKYKNEVLYEMVISVCSICLLHPDMADLWTQLNLSQNCVFTCGRFLHDQRLYMRFLPAEGVSAL